ncbi:MAG: WYL domain-containing protein [Tabrizicola sp.]|nr:WYL domain-containing protein [Tabrizicola sp.]
MPRLSTLDRLDRLEHLTAALKSGERLTQHGLAESLGISLRTLSRDIELLRRQGLPIEADRGRGGGLRLSQRWGVGRLALSYAEAVDLLISLAIAEQMGSPLLLSNLASTRRKLIASFSPTMTAQIAGLKARIRVGRPAVPSLVTAAAAPLPEVTAALNQAFLSQLCLAITYRAPDGQHSHRVIHPHYLMLSAPVWYVLAWDELRGDTRTFRCDRITGARVEDDQPFKLMPFARFEAALAGIATI